MREHAGVWTYGAVYALMKPQFHTPAFEAPLPVLGSHRLILGAGATGIRRAPDVEDGQESDMERSDCCRRE